MHHRHFGFNQARLVFFMLLTLFLVAGCGASDSTTSASDQGEGSEPVERTHEAEMPPLTPADLPADELLQVVATTSIIADIVGQVGGDQILLTTLFPAGADAHSYEPTPQDLVSMENAHVIFVNGLGLEASLDALLPGLDGVPVVSVNAGVETAELGGEHDPADEGQGEKSPTAHAHVDTDPHTWFSVHAVEKWTENVAQTLSTLDPDNARTYQANAAAYLEQLAALETELDSLMASLPVEKRKLVTDHEALGYLAAAYDLDIVGAVIPSLSTMASPSARDLAALQDQIAAEDVSAIFVGVGTNSGVATQIAQDSGVKVVPIYVGTLSEADGPASTYLDFMRYTVTQIVEALE